jgi:hypothetical protein
MRRLSYRLLLQGGRRSAGAVPRGLYRKCAWSGQQQPMHTCSRPLLGPVGVKCC